MHKCIICFEGADIYALKPDLAICQACGLVFQPSIPTDETFKKLYSEPYYNSWGGSDHSAYWQLKITMARSLIKSSGLNLDGKFVLDIGCATGASLAAFENQRAIVYGIDINPYAISKAAALVPNAKLFNRDIKNADFGGQKFDVITMFDVLEHVLDPIETLCEVKKHLKPNGLVVVLTPNIRSVSLNVFKKNWPHFKQEHLYYFDKRTLRNLFAACGFQVNVIKSFWKPLNPFYVIRQFQAYRHPVLTPILNAIDFVMPPVFKRFLLKVPVGEILGIATFDEKGSVQ